jgi:hypothetical protein
LAHLGPITGLSTDPDRSVPDLNLRMEEVGMTSMATTAVFVTGGVDTHGQTHHAAVLDYIGRQLGDREFPTSPAGYRALLQ